MRSFIVVLATGISLLAAPVAFAGEHHSSNTAIVIQNGSKNFVLVYQGGQHNTAVVVQMNHKHHNYN